MELIKNAGFLVLGFLVIGNGVLSTLEECRYWRVCDIQT